MNYRNFCQMSKCALVARHRYEAGRYFSNGKRVSCSNGKVFSSSLLLIMSFSAGLTFRNARSLKTSQELWTLSRRIRLAIFLAKDRQRNGGNTLTRIYSQDTGRLDESYCGTPDRQVLQVFLL